MYLMVLKYLDAYVENIESRVTTRIRGSLFFGYKRLTDNVDSTPGDI